MISGIRAELRKIFTVRSTYGIFLFVFGLAVALVGFWVFGYKDVEHAARSPAALMSALYQMISIGSIILAFLALLSVGHEYRYNTILYAMTATNRRSKILLTKWLALMLVTLVAGAVVSVLGYLAFYLGQNLAHISTINQTMPNLEYVWRAAATFVGAQSLAFVLAVLVRSQILAISIFLITPLFVEGILTLVLKDNVKYLPFTALGNIAATNPPLANTTSALIVAAYVVGFGFVAWLLFLRRDAN